MCLGMALSPRCAACSTSCTPPTSRSSTCRSTPLTWTTCSSPSPATPPLNQQSRARKHLRNERSRLHPHRLGHHAASQPQTSAALPLSLIHISEPTRLLSISYAVFCLKK